MIDENNALPVPLPPIDVTKLVRRDSASMQATVEYEGIKFTIRYLTRAKLGAISQDCLFKKYDPGTKSRVQELDRPKFLKKLVNEIVVGWSGLTPRTLASITPEFVAPDKDRLDEEIPYSVEQLVLLLEICFGLTEFIEKMATDANVFRPEHQDELKNS